jgi:hypothetical protein
MELKKLFEELLKEVQGISSEVRLWSPILAHIVRKAKQNVFTVEGKNFNVAYDKFPVDVFHITLTTVMTAYDENKSGYDDNGDYVVYFYISTMADTQTVKSNLDHELRHAFEDYKRRSSGTHGLSQTREGIDFFSGDFEKLMMTKDTRQFFPFDRILTGLYITSKLEESAYSETVHNNELRIIDMLKQQLNANYPQLLETLPKLIEQNWINLKKNINIPIFNKFDDAKSLIMWADNYIKNRGEKVLKKLMKIKYLKNIK